MSDEKTPVVETKEPPKEKKVPDMSKVREAKKRKQQERDTTLSVLQNQLSTMATMMKPDLKPVMESDDEDEGPMVVIRKKQFEVRDFQDITRWTTRSGYLVCSECYVRPKTSLCP